MLDNCDCASCARSRAPTSNPSKAGPGAAVYTPSSGAEPPAFELTTRLSALVRDSVEDIIADYVRDASREQLVGLAKGIALLERDKAQALGCALVYESAGLELPGISMKGVSWLLSAKDTQIQAFAEKLVWSDSSTACALFRTLSTALSAHHEANDIRVAELERGKRLG